MIKNNHPPEKTLIIFAREPKDGKVKTRLLKALSISSITSLYKAFLKDILNMAKAPPMEQRYIYYVGHGKYIPFLRQFSKNFKLYRQMGASLGVRMHRAFQRTYNTHHGPMLLIGTDCLSLTPQNLYDAFDKLTTHDIVIGPSHDGGYYLIGLKRPCAALFNNITWSSEKVLAQTRDIAARHHLTVALLENKEDIDTIGNLKNLYDQDPTSWNTNTRKELDHIAKDQSWT